MKRYGFVPADTALVALMLESLERLAVNLLVCGATSPAVFDLTAPRVAGSFC